MSHNNTVKLDIISKTMKLNESSILNTINSAIDEIINNHVYARLKEDILKEYNRRSICEHFDFDVVNVNIYYEAKRSSEYLEMVIVMNDQKLEVTHSSDPYSTNTNFTYGDYDGRDLIEEHCRYMYDFFEAVESFLDSHDYENLTPILYKLVGDEHGCQCMCFTE